MNAPRYDDESALIAALVAREEGAYRFAIKSYHASMINLARSIVGEKIADEVVQESWFSVMNALPRFEQRSSLKTWMLRIVANEARSRLRKEGRQVSLEAMTDGDPDLLARFDERGHWIKGDTPSDWGAASPDELITKDELEACLELAIESLPEMQGATLRLREQQDYSLAEICNILDVSESNVRVLLHRARSRLYNVIEHFQETGECSAKS